MSIKQQFKKIVHLLKWTHNYPVTYCKKSSIMMDYLNLYKTKGLTLEEYYEFEMEKRNPKFREDFLGIREQRYYLEQLNPIKYFIFARNKYVAHRMMEQTGIRTSELYCYYEPMGMVNDSKDVATNVADVVRILRKKGVETCVMKSTEGSHGSGVFIIKQISYISDDCEILLSDGRKELLSKVVNNSPLVFESVVNQTRQFALMNESSVNTIRFMTVLMPDGSAEVIAAFIKIGRVGSFVDNAGAGGNLDAAIDLRTGEINYAVQFDGWRQIKEIEKHPDSGMQLNGIVIENWDQIKAEVTLFQQAFPWCKAAGWDIAVTDEGPLVIEVNDMWDRTGQYFIRKGWRKPIRNCYNAWKSVGYNVNRGRLENDFSTQKCRLMFGSES